MWPSARATSRDSCTGPTLTAKARDHLRIPVCVRSAGKPQPTCALVGEATQMALGPTCPSWIVATNGGYYSVVWTTNGPRGPLPASDKLSLGDKLALATDLSAATARGDLARRPAMRAESADQPLGQERAHRGGNEERLHPHVHQTVDPAHGVVGV